MTLEEYLEHLTDINAHALRQMIEMERETLDPETMAETIAAYTLALDYIVAAKWKRYLAEREQQTANN